MGTYRAYGILVAALACALLTGMDFKPPSSMVTSGLKGEPLSGDDCLKKCIGCPFHEHRYFYKYSMTHPTIESETKGIFPVFYGGQVISRIGDHRDGRRHMGIDIAAKKGSAVVAAWTGRVKFAGWNSLGGWVVLLQHANGYVTYYAHLKDKPRLYPGQRIIAGQRLGAVGKSGNAQNTIPHLHFEVQTGSGRVLNPLNVL